MKTTDDRLHKSTQLRFNLILKAQIREARKTDRKVVEIAKPVIYEFERVLDESVAQAKAEVISDIYSKAHEFANADPTMVGSQYLKAHHWTSAIDAVSESAQR